jgi:regulatory protein
MPGSAPRSVSRLLAVELPVDPQPPPAKKSKRGLSLRAQALSLLARREYSNQELARRLLQYTEDPDEIPPLLAEFEQRGWLSEKRVVEQVLATRRKRFGSQKITHELRQKGLSDEAIAGARESLKAGELDAAREVWRKKFATPPANAREKASQMRFLQGRGFGLDVIRKVISGGDDE